MQVSNPLSLKNIHVTRGFWRERIDNVSGKVIPYQWDALNDNIPGAEPSHSVENFRIAAGEKKGKFYGLIFQDSDVGKWIEAASYSLIDTRNADLETAIDGVVELIERSQEDDGYLDTYFSVTVPEKRWTDLAMGHEMYCGGHLIEGAVAYYHATGKRRFLDVMIRYADHLVRRFGPGPDQVIGYCGHPEIELALMKLADVTGNQAYQTLSRFFVDERGKHPEVLDNSKVIDWGGGGPHINPWHQEDYYQDHAPVREQAHADGHAVRAMYLYSAMADQWRLTGDPTLGRALEALWSSATERRMYVTGALGSQGLCERFTIDYDLPSDTAYAETCAAIGLIFWAWRMTLAQPHRKYADALERALYNGALSGISLDGTRYFYVNPLQVDPAVIRARKDHDFVKTERVQWFGCACCPPNIARLVCSVAQFAYSWSGKDLLVHQFVSSEAEIAADGGVWKIVQTSDYPWEGESRLVVERAPGEASLGLRIPGAVTPRLKVNGEDAAFGIDENGYAQVRRVWKDGDVLTVSFELEVQVLRSHPLVRELAGQVAVQRGPVVYCAEQADNGENLHLLRLDPSQPFRVEPGIAGGKRLAARGTRLIAEAPSLYSTAPARSEACDIVLVPYYAWGNRGAGEMRVWLYGL